MKFNFDPTEIIKILGAHLVDKGIVEAGNYNVQGYLHTNYTGLVSISIEMVKEEKK